MTSIQTQYRAKRTQLLKDMIAYIIDLTQLQKKQLEKIPLPQLKRITEEIKTLYKQPQKREKAF